MTAEACVVSEAARCSVIVVSHDSGAWLGACVRSVLAQDTALELIVVDNASRDGSIERLPPDARLSIVRNTENRGFSVACNQGAARARGAQLLFLNPDCELPEGAIRALCLALECEANIGLLGAQLLNDDGSPQAASRRRTPTPWRALRALGSQRNRFEPGTAEPVAGSIDEVEAISGALMLMPRAAFDALGGFDEGYVLHCEDLDLCRRALAGGYRVAIAHRIAVTHHKGTSSRGRPIWVEWQKHRGMLRYFRKFDAATSPWWLRLAVPVGVWLRFPYAALRAWGRARWR